LSFHNNNANRTPTVFRKAYGELPDTAKINETDTFGPGEDGDCGFEFDEDRDSESDTGGNAGGSKEIDIEDI
jgi:translation initiation factor 1A